MRKDKEKALELRKQSRSYKEINNILHIPKSTLSGWFSKEVWSMDIKRQKVSGDKVMQRIRRMNDIRMQKLQKHYENARNEAFTLYSRYKNEPLFVSALMLYLGEGDKSLKNNSMRISNSDFIVLKIFILFLIKYLDIPKIKIKIWLLLYPDINEASCKDRWMQETGLKTDNFHKSQVIQGKHKTKRLIYGVGNIIIGNKYLKVKILELIRLSTSDLSKADVV